MIRAKDNPFAIHRLEALGFLADGESLEQIADRLEQLNYTAAIVGPHGSGKTTLLRNLQKHFSQKGFQTESLFLNLDTKLPWSTIKECVDAMEVGSVLFFDGACHLPFWRFKPIKRKLYKHRIGLVITSHQEGLLPTLVLHRPSPKLLKRIINALPIPDNKLADADLENLFHKNHGNIRDCLWQLYDEYPFTENAVRRREDGERNSQPAGAGRRRFRRRRDRHRESPAGQNPCPL